MIVTQCIRQSRHSIVPQGVAKEVQTFQRRVPFERRRKRATTRRMDVVDPPNRRGSEMDVESPSATHKFNCLTVQRSLFKIVATAHAPYATSEQPQPDNSFEEDLISKAIRPQVESRDGWTPPAAGPC